jgi:hypothetical protein
MGVGAAAAGGASAAGPDTKGAHKFWSTQPVPDFDDTDTSEGPIEPDKRPEEVRATPYNLPTGYVWTDVDINNDAQVPRGGVPVRAVPNV